jgi:hypothetical protein
MWAPIPMARSTRARTPVSSISRHRQYHLQRTTATATCSPATAAPRPTQASTCPSPSCRERARATPSFTDPSTSASSATTCLHGHHLRQSRTTPADLAYEKDMTTGSVTLEERVFISAGGDPGGDAQARERHRQLRALLLCIATTSARRSPSPTAPALPSSGSLTSPSASAEPPTGPATPRDAIKGVNTDRGFTDHEHLDDLALIHMNGRVFDPLIGRFLFRRLQCAALHG